MGLTCGELQAVKELNRVEGFDPCRYLREIVDERQGKQVYLDVKYRKLWFRLKYPFGKITKKIIHLTEQYAIVEARVYLDKNDPEENYVSCALAQRYYSAEDTFGKRYVEMAETAAIGRALADAGFGIQFCDIGDESDPGQVDSGIAVQPEQGDSSGYEKTADGAGAESPMDEASSSTTARTVKKAPTKSVIKQTISKNMPVEELCKIMTLDDAKGIVIDFGKKKGDTLGIVAVATPQNLDWFINSYKGDNNVLRAGARILKETALSS